MNRIVTTPTGDPVGYARLLPTGFWVAADDVNDGFLAWFHT